MENESEFPKFESVYILVGHTEYKEKSISIYSFETNGVLCIYFMNLYNTSKYTKKIRETSKITQPRYSRSISLS